VTHAELCARAGVWLRARQGCQVTMIEKGTNGEVADAFGVKWPDLTYLIECKTSRADFLSDQRKAFRTPTGGMGRYRYYMTRPGLLDPAEIPAGWGLLEVHPVQIRVQVWAVRRTEYDRGKEWRMVMKLMLDLKWRGCLSPNASRYQGVHPKLGSDRDPGIGALR